MKLEHSSENMVAVSTIDRNNTEKNSSKCECFQFGFAEIDAGSKK